MALGKLKDAWPIWLLLVVAIVIIVLVAKSSDENEGVVSFKTTVTTVPPTNTVVQNTDNDVDAPVVEEDNDMASESESPESPESPESSKSPVTTSQVIDADLPPKKITGIFSIQVYSFKEEDRAKQALQSIKQGGYDDAYILVSDLGEKGTWHRVRVGYFDDEEKAKELLQQLRTDFNSGIIVRN